MQYKIAIQTLAKKVIRRGIQYNLDTVRSALSELNHPENLTSRVIHLAGTNGKGSTVAFLKSGFIGAGLTVGAYTSPHILSYCERIQYQGQPITEPDFARLFKVIYSLSSYARLTEFECLTLMFFLYMQEKKPHIILLETGLGGRLDATNVVRKDVAVITSIGMDHEAVLGDSLTAIAIEKAGIIQAEKPVFSAVQDPSVITVLQEVATKNACELTVVPPLSSIPSGSKLIGVAQQQNRALARAVLSVFLSRRESKGLEEDLNQATHWGRLTQVTYAGKSLLIDGAHNPQAIEALVKTLKNQYAQKKWTVLVQVLKTRSLKKIVEGLAPITKKIYYVLSQDSQFWNPLVEETHLALEYIEESQIKTHIQLCDDPILVTGSLYFVAKFKG